MTQTNYNKIAINANTDKDRAAIKFHDIGLQVVKNAQQEIGFEVWVGGGLGRTPIVGEKLNGFVHWGAGAVTRICFNSNQHWILSTLIGL